MSPRVRERLRAVADRLPPRVRRGLARWRQAGTGRPAPGVGGGAADRPGRTCAGHARRRTRAAGGHPRDPAGGDGPAPASPGRHGSRGGLASPPGEWSRTTWQTTGRVRRELGSCRRPDALAALPLPASAAPARSSRDAYGRARRGPDSRARRAGGLCCTVVAHPAPRAAPGPARAVGQDRGRRRAGRSDRRGLLAGRGVLRGRQPHLARRCLIACPALREGREPDAGAHGEGLG